MDGSRPALVLMGYQSKAVEPYTDEIAALVAKLGDGVLTYTPCYSRETGVPKMYVQQALEQQGERVWELLSAGAKVYICGQPRMAHAVEEVLNALALEYDDAIGFADAALFSTALFNEGRLLKDIFTETEKL